VKCNTWMNAPSSRVLDVLLEQCAPASDAFNTLVRFAAHQTAGDLFCSACPDGYRLSIRCDGLLRRLGDVPRTWGEKLIGYAKVEARLDAAEHRRPQDGRIIVDDEGQSIDVRVATMPTFFGEDMALRILDRRNQLLEFDELGMTASERNAVRALISQPFGLILVTGAAGAGKTTTLYGILNELNDGTRKINTIEDPVEYHLEGAHQTQVNPRIGMDFADLLPAVLRQDPDVMMVGEVRDAATAQTTLRAAVTGQLVFATLHASSAAGAIHSMLGLGVHSHLLAGALRGVIAQNLVRRLCPECVEVLEPTARLAMFEEIRPYLPRGIEPVLHQGRGCENCNGCGYRGRMGLFEVLTATPEIAALIERSATPDTIAAQAISEGMIPLDVRARIAVARGSTTVEEAMRVVDLKRRGHRRSVLEPAPEPEPMPEALPSPAMAV